jgi:hypothetical protein
VLSLRFILCLSSVVYLTSLAITPIIQWGRQSINEMSVCSVGGKVLIYVSSFHVTTLYITSLIYTQSPLEFPFL